MSLAVGLRVAGSGLFVEQLPEHRVDIILIADVLHGKIVKHRL
jgi:hypothetical protein